jgi:hypothetical protein
LAPEFNAGAPNRGLMTDPIGHRNIATIGYRVAALDELPG